MQDKIKQGTINCQLNHAWARKSALKCDLKIPNVVQYLMSKAVYSRGKVQQQWRHNPLWTLD